MADRGLHGPPYWRALIGYISQRIIWRRFDGSALHRGTDVLSLPADRFCNLIEYWIEQYATEEKEIRDARDRMAVVLARIADPPDPSEIDDTLPPHLAGRY